MLNMDLTNVLDAIDYRCYSLESVIRNVIFVYTVFLRDVMDSFRIGQNLQKMRKINNFDDIYCSCFVSSYVVFYSESADKNELMKLTEFRRLQAVVTLYSYTGDD